MEQGLKKFVAVFLISILTLSTTSAIAASPTATPKPSTKTTATETKKPATKKPTVKKKKVVKKKKKKLPPLQAVVCFGKAWPPSGFSKNGEVFAKIPTAAQLQCESSDNNAPSKVFLRADLPKCDEFACGAITVASENRCSWCEETLGSLRTVSKGTNARVFQSIMLVSGIKHKDATGKILNNIKASNLAISCHHNPAPELTNRNFFTPN
jgi:hypothetical protein